MANYRVTDAYGQVSTGTYTPTVSAGTGTMPKTGGEFGSLTAVGSALAGLVLLMRRRRAIQT